MTKPIIKAEYIWLDGCFPTQALRSKTRLITKTSEKAADLDNFPEWGYDGSSTSQAEGNDSDLILRPIRAVRNPLLEVEAYLVMCEVFESDTVSHKTNHRAKLRSTMEKGAQDAKAWFGFEQEYTFYSGDVPMGWPNDGYPAPQGPFYCGVGAELAYGRKVVEAHTDACIKAGLLLFGTNAEVMPGQWEFQLGYRGNDDEDATAISVSDELWLARWLLIRIAEEHGVRVSFECKPVKGDWNGAGMHTNFSTAEMRDPRTGSGAIENAVVALGKNHDRHIPLYGAGLNDRLTGEHETCSIEMFRHGVADRGASIRIPRHVAKSGHGYIEDRRPGANANPYQVCDRLLNTILNLD